MRSDLYEYRTETDSNHANRFSAISIHFGRLDNYQSSWTLIDKAVFEALLVNSRTYGNEAFYFQQARWEDQIGVTWHMIKQSLFRFQEMGFISIERREPKKKYYYTVNYSVIIKNLHKIYDFSGIVGEDLSGVKSRLKTFFEYWSSFDFNYGTKLKLEDGELTLKYEGVPLVEEEDTKDIEYVPVTLDDENIDHESES